MSANESTVNQLDHQNDGDDFFHTNEALLGGVGAILLPLGENLFAFHVTNKMLQFLQARGVFGGLDENPHEHIQNFVEICSPYSLKGISEESVRLRLFPFSLMGEATKWLVDLPRNSITTWDKITVSFFVRFFPPSRMMTLRDNIQGLKRVEAEPIHETWLNFSATSMSDTRSAKPSVITTFL